MNEITDGVAIALGDGEDFDLTLYSDGTLRVDVEDANGGEAKLVLNLDEARAIHEALGHLLWVASR